MLIYSLFQHLLFSRMLAGVTICSLLVWEYLLQIKLWKNPQCLISHYVVKCPSAN